MIITHSSLECFKQCRQKFKFRYIEGICPVTKSNALEFGSQMHLILQHLFECVEAQQTKGDTEYDPKESVIDRLCQMVEIADMEAIDRAKLKGLIIGYVNKWYESDCQEYVIIDVEHEFSFQIPHYKISYKPTFVGKVDGIVKRKSDGKYFILEHKTAAIIDDDYIAQKQIDSQTMTYACFIQETMGIKVSGAIHDIITKQKIRLKKGETEEQFCQRLIDDVTNDNFNRIVVEFDESEMIGFVSELDNAIEDVVFCDKYYKCTGQCIGRYGACEYLPLCRNKCDLSGLEGLYTQRKPHEEISNETLEGEWE